MLLSFCMSSLGRFSGREVHFSLLLLARFAGLVSLHGHQVFPWRRAARDGQGASRLRRPLPERRCAPALLVLDEQGNGVALLLTFSMTNRIDWELAARVLEVEGDLELHSGTLILRVQSWRLAQ
jgi:hypothetical protein